MKQNTPKVSIITPSYNQGEFIEETIKSVLSQDYPNLEYIIMDGGSSDNTIKLLKKYNGKLKWFSEKDNGQMDALNKGLRLATGDIVAFLNSDDFYLPNTINTVVEYFTKNPSSEIVTGDYKIIDTKGKEIQTLVVLWKKLLRRIHGFNIFCIANYINQPSTFWRRRVINKVGYFNEKLHYVFDYEYWLRIFKLGIKIDILEKKLCSYRIHNKSKGGSQYRKRSEEELSVQKKYNKNLIIYGLHYLHNKLMVIIYDLLN